MLDPQILDQSNFQEFALVNRVFSLYCLENVLSILMAPRSYNLVEMWNIIFVICNLIGYLASNSGNQADAENDSP